MCSVFLSSYRNTCESLGELEEAVETLASGLAFLVLPNFHSCFYNSIETRYVFFYFLNVNDTQKEASEVIPIEDATGYLKFEINYNKNEKLKNN